MPKRERVFIHSLHVAISADMHSAINKAAKEEHVDASVITRWALEEYLNKKRK